MALEHILAAIEHEAAQQIARLEADSRAAAAAILDQAQAQVSIIETAKAEERDGDLQADAARLLNQAHVAATRHILRTREAVFQRALEQAQIQLAAVRARSDYSAILRALLAEALAALPGDGAGSPVNGVAVHCDQRDAAQVQALLESAAFVDHHVASVAPSLDTWGGVDVATPDGRIIVHNTLESRMARAESHLRRLVWQVLGAAGDGRG